MEKQTDSFNQPRSSGTSREASRSRSYSDRDQDGAYDPNDLNGDKSSRDDKKQKRKPYDIIFYPTQDYLDHLLKDDEKLFLQLERAADTSVYKRKEIDTGGPEQDAVIAIFDEDEKKKWEASDNLFENFSLFWEEHKKPTDKPFEVVIVIPNGKPSFFFFRLMRFCSNSQEWYPCSSERRGGRSPI